jgi:EAL domain-containing protein (putative c-di-GMP-specific phosphodiesterase class I)
LDHATEEIGLYVYDDIMEQQSKSKTELVPHLLYAIQNEEFSLVYQPKGNLNGDNTISVEALLRWNHPTRGQISPGEFINIAEEIGIIGEITKWVIKNVIDQEEKWKKAGMSIKIALNISPKDFDNQSVMDLFTELIENEERDLSLLEIELTERCILKNQEIVI